MTCIVGIQTQDDVILAADSMSASAGFKNVSVTPKLVRLSISQRGLADEVLTVGFTTSWRMGNLLAAKSLAGVGYDMAKTAAKFAASERLIAKARQMQGDALLIECRAKVRIADEWDAAQARGEASAGGRPKKSQKPADIENNFTAKQVGLTRTDVFLARRLRDAEKQSPGICDRAIAAQLAVGFEPTRVAVVQAADKALKSSANKQHGVCASTSARAKIGTQSATRQERGNDFYQTPREGIHALLCVEQFGPDVWEPSCGHGAISKPMEDAGYRLMLSDMVDRGCATRDGELQQVGSFLETQTGHFNRDGGPECDIVTNPPFGIVNDYIHHALTVHRPRKMAMLLNLNAMCGHANENRNFWMEAWPPARIWAFSRRLPMMHREGWEGHEGSSQMNTAWFVGERQLDAGAADEPVYGSQTLLKRLDWKALDGAKALGPEARG